MSAEHLAGVVRENALTAFSSRFFGHVEPFRQRGVLPLEIVAVCSDLKIHIASDSTDRKATSARSTGLHLGVPFGVRSGAFWQLSSAIEGHSDSW